jgi:hypothetical protein
MKKIRSYTLSVTVVLTAWFVLIGMAPAQEAKEISVLGGVIVNDSQKTGAWQLDYSQPIKEPFRFSISYLNEGHFTDHHRDGIATQAWAETKFSRFRLGVGIGPYLYFDTHNNDSISRGIGGVMSLDGKYFVSDSWFLTLRYNYIVASRMNTQMLFGGLGYNFDATAKVQPVAKQKWQPDTKNEVALYAGKSILNNHEGNGFAGAIEYRRNLSKHFDATLMYLNESKERQGGAVQLWAVQRLFEDRLSLGIGAGIYEAFEKHPHELTTNGIITTGLGYRLYGNWEARLNFSRVIAPRDRDADIIMAGVGFKF